MRLSLIVAVLAVASAAQAKVAPSAQPPAESAAPVQAAPAQAPKVAEAKPAVRLRHTKPGGQTFVTGGGLICQHVGEKIACF